MHIAPEHENEPELGLPEPLPATERIVWQGSPEWKTLAVRAFHVRTLAIYFAVLLAVSATVAVVDGEGLRASAFALGTFASLAVVAVGTLAVLAWLAARTAVYTVTDKRVVMRIGIVLSVTYNLPFAQIGGAALGATTGDRADIALTLEGPDRIAYLNLWPHARPWHVRTTQPMLRCVPDGRRVAALLAGAWAAHRGIALPVEAAPTAPAAAPASASLAFARAATEAP